DAPIAQAQQVTPMHGELVGEAPNLVYKPSLGYFGADAFSYTVTAEGMKSEPATVSIDVLKAADRWSGGGVGCGSTGGGSVGMLVALLALALTRRRKRTVARPVASIGSLELVATRVPPFTLRRTVALPVASIGSLES